MMPKRRSSGMMIAGSDGVDELWRQRGSDNHQFALASVQNRRETGAEPKSVGFGEGLIDDDLVLPARLWRAAQAHIKPVQLGLTDVRQ